jgi:hypothetical protein
MFTQLMCGRNGESEQMPRAPFQPRSISLRLGSLLTAYALSTTWSAAQVRHERIGVAPPIYKEGGERFPAVNIVEGQSVRVVMSNVLSATGEAASIACPLTIRFFDTEGAPLGSEQTARLMPGASASVVATSRSKLIRATVSVANFSDPKKACAVKTMLEVFDARSGGTLFVVPSAVCLGNGACSAPMTAP